MDQHENREPVVLTRDELYRQVWETPMIRLGEKYGISGNGLKKICDRLEVPYPPLGYWAKLRAGKSTKQATLAEPDPNTPREVRISRTPPAPPVPQIDPEVAEQLKEARAATPPTTVPEILRKPHPIIAAWIAEHNRRVAEAKRDRSGWGGYKPQPFTELEHRQQRILDTLFKSVERKGFAVKGDAPHQMWLETEKEKVEINLRERVRQVRRPLTDEEKSRGFLYSGQKWRQEKLPTGELIFSIKTYLGSALTTEWRDGEHRLEEQLGEILSVLSLAGPILRERRRQAEEAERRRWEDEQRRQQEQAKRQQDKNRWRRFIELAARWEEAELAARFLEALQQLPINSEQTFGGRTTAEWLTWAKEKRDEFDPLRWESGDVWSNIASVASWEYHD